MQATQSIYGYRNIKTNVLFQGFTPMLDMLSDLSHPDNRGRLETFVNDPEYGRLDWEKITDETKWKELVAQYGAGQGFSIEIKTTAAPPMSAVTPPVKPKSKTVTKKPKKPVVKKPVEVIKTDGEQTA